jgi:molybdate transport system substrate-binding protein
MQAQVPLTGISSMATRQLLADLAADFGRPVSIESVGGVDAARRVQAGEAFDVVVLASTAIDKLIGEGHLQPGRVDIVRSGVAVAVRAGAARPDIATEEALRRAVEAARSVSYSTGPSGVHLARLFERWGIAAQIKDRIVEAPPGVPVGSLVARGEVELGFQQLSELMHLDGIEVLGPLPPAVQVLTTFSGGVGMHSAQPEGARDFLVHLASPASADAKRRHGMEPV